MADNNLENIKVIDRNIEDVMHQSMMPYAEHVILDRALPRVEDGLKPVQRRILFSMYELGVTADKPYKKSARIVGDCLGKYHPHGDTSVYGALVRMAQDFSLSTILVDGQGNFGSTDGDPPAAMRYTEVKLSPIASELLQGIDKDTVKWTLNFDDTCKEPETLPGRFPNLLVNGASGIAVGIATNIPPHNLTEVIGGVIAFIDNPKIKLDEMMAYIKAPDFPTKGSVIIGQGLVEAYETGRGKILIRAKVSIEKNDDKESIIIHELPYQVIKSKLLQKISLLREIKKELFGNIADIVDETDRNGMRAVIKIKKEGNAAKILEKLFIHTDMQISFGINMVAIADGKPQQLGLLRIINYYVEYQREVVLRRTQYDLSEARAKEHILQGILIAVENIDEVIKIIRAAASITDCKATLRERFKISEKQAQAILDIRLARLTKLEVTKLRQELAELAELINKLQAIVISRAKQLTIVKQELEGIKKNYKQDRRSVILREGINQSFDIVDVNAVEEKKGVLLLSEAERFKFLTNKAYLMASKDLANCNENEVARICMFTDNSKPLYAFTNLGNAYQLNVNDLGDDKWKGKGLDANKVIPLLKDESIISIFSYEQIAESRLLFLTESGITKCTEGKEYLIDRKQFEAIKLKEKDKVLSVEIKDDSKTILMVTKDGICLNMESDIPAMGRRTSGVIGISLNEGDDVIYASQIDDEGEVVTITDNGYAKRVIASFIKTSNRNRKGNKIHDLTPKSGSRLIFACSVKQPFDIALIGESGSVVGINTEEVAIENLITKGASIKNVSGVIKKAAKHNIMQ